MRVGLDHLYRLDHASAIRSFEELTEELPTHPGPVLAVAMATWLQELFSRQELELDRFISPGYFTRPREEPMDPARREKFFDGVEASQRLANQWLESHPGDPHARYYLGAAEGALGVFAFTIDRSYRAALRHGRASYEIQREIIESHPDFADSYLTVGTYEYIVGNLPWYVKWIATIAGYRGSEARGFEYLVKASTEGQLVRDDARVLLMVLYVREKEYDYALSVVSELHARFPENFLLHLNRAQILERLGRPAEAVDTLLDVIARAEEGRPAYDRLDLSELRVPVASRLEALGNPLAAVAQLDAVGLDESAGSPERVSALLAAGRLLESEERLDDARARYEEVLILEDIDGSRRAAERRLEALR